VRLQGYTNFNWAGNVVHRLSTSRCYFSLGSITIYGIRRRQVFVALDTKKIEYISTSVASREAV
jgi:hypothetical protein